MVRRRRVGVGHVPGFLSDDAAVRICVRRLDDAFAEAPRPGDSARGAPCMQPRPAADHSGGRLEAGRERYDESGDRDTRIAPRDDRPSVLPALDDEPARAGVVLAPIPSRCALSPLRAFERGLAARAPVLSGADRAQLHARAPIGFLVGGLCGFRGPVRGSRHRDAQARFGRRCRAHGRRGSLRPTNPRPVPDSGFYGSGFRPSARVCCSR